MKKDAVIIGAGLTGLTLAFLLRRAGKTVLVVEKNTVPGGAMQTRNEDGYTFETGPNTGVISRPEVTELFEMLGLEPEIAAGAAEKRLILKNNRWHALPSGPKDFFGSPLFSVSDKIGIMFEPLRPKGKNPDESVADLARRRLGKSFVDYAVNPFISGIYAGDPERLVTRYALPKLYNLDQNCGGFIRGAVKKSREKLSVRDMKATKKVFSVRNGFGTLIDALCNAAGVENIICGAKSVWVNKNEGKYVVNFTESGNVVKVETETVVTAVGSYALPELLPFISECEKADLTNAEYAKVVQVAVGLKENVLDAELYRSFGGLIPQKEKRDVLGILFPSFCFADRAPRNCSTLAVYLGGICRQDIFGRTDSEIENTVTAEIRSLFGVKEDGIRLMRIFRHTHAIPQYEKTSGDRFAAALKTEGDNRGLFIGGNLRDGIGIADRIKQAFDIAARISAK